MATAAPTWETVYERNSVERIKRDKPPLGIREELPALIAAGYERMPEEDIVRLQWWGLYHDKPKIGTFMLRVKIPSGIVEPRKLRAIGEVSNRYGRGDAELHRPLQRAGDQLRLARRRGERRPRGIRRPGGRRTRVGAADRPRSRRLRSEGAVERDSRCGDVRVERGSEVPHVACEGPAEVH